MGFLDKLKEQVKEDLKTGPPLSLENLGGFPKVAGNTVFIKAGKEPNTLRINNETYQVTSLNWNEHGERSAGKAAVGAVVGGVLTGGIGLLAGAALGGRKKDVSCAIVGIKDGDVDYTLYLRCTQKEFRQLTQKLSGC